MICGKCYRREYEREVVADAEMWTDYSEENRKDRALEVPDTDTWCEPGEVLWGSYKDEDRSSLHHYLSGNGYNTVHVVREGETISVPYQELFPALYSRDEKECPF